MLLCTLHGTTKPNLQASMAALRCLFIVVSRCHGCSQPTSVSMAPQRCPSSGTIKRPLSHSSCHCLPATFRTIPTGKVCALCTPAWIASPRIGAGTSTQMRGCVRKQRRLSACPSSRSYALSAIIHTYVHTHTHMSPSLVLSCPVLSCPKRPCCVCVHSTVHHRWSLFGSCVLFQSASQPASQWRNTTAKKTQLPVTNNATNERTNESDNPSPARPPPTAADSHRSQTVTHSLTHSLTHSPTVFSHSWLLPSHSPIHPFTHSPTHSLAHWSLTHSLTVSCYVSIIDILAFWVNMNGCIGVNCIILNVEGTVSDQEGRKEGRRERNRKVKPTSAWCSVIHSHSLSHSEQ